MDIRDTDLPGVKLIRPDVFGDERGWFLENGYFESAKSGAVRDQVDALSAELAEMSLAVVDGFGIPDAVIRAPIGLSEAP